MDRRLGTVYQVDQLLYLLRRHIHATHACEKSVYAWSACHAEEGAFQLLVYHTASTR